MTHRSQYEIRGPRQAGRPQDDYARSQGRDARFDRPFDDDAPRGYYARDEMSEWDAGIRGERQYGAYDPGDRDQGQYLGSYPSEQGPRYYGGGRPSREEYARNAQPGGRYGGAYGPEDFRQGSGARPYEPSRNLPRTPQAAYPPSRYLGSRYEPLENQGPGQRTYTPGAYARDFEEDHYDYGQSFGGYSPSQAGFGQGYSGYGRGGYGMAPGDTLRQDVDQELYGTSNSSLGSNFGAGVGNNRLGYGGFGRGQPERMAGAPRYGRSFEADYGTTRRESQFGKGPRGYVRSDERLKDDISERLLRDHDVDASDIDIEVKNGKVTLTGSIADRRLKHYVEDTVEQCLGVQDIDNRLTVRNTARTGDTGTSFAGQAASTGTTGSRTTTTTTPGSGSLGGSTGEDGKEPTRRN
jgi:osmotically-inducible protein OsmY